MLDVGPAIIYSTRAFSVPCRIIIEVRIMKRIKCGLHIGPFTLFLLGLSATSILGFAVRPAGAQILYAVDSSSDNLYRVSTTNAALTLVGNTGVSLGSLAYRPSNGFLYGFTTGTDAALYRVNP